MQEDNNHHCQIKLSPSLMVFLSKESAQQTPILFCPHYMRFVVSQMQSISGLFQLNGLNQKLLPLSLSFVASAVKRCLLLICSVWTEITLLSYWADTLKTALLAEPAADHRLSPGDVEASTFDGFFLSGILPPVIVLQKRLERSE